MGLGLHAAVLHDGTVPGLRAPITNKADRADHDNIAGLKGVLLAPGISGITGCGGVSVYVKNWRTTIASGSVMFDGGGGAARRVC